jgi:FAD/FMN-containing dehydrogenase
LVFGFNDDIEGADAVPSLLTAEPFTVESLSAELLALAQEQAADVGLPEGGAWLMVEARAGDASGARDHAERLAATIGRSLDAPDVRFIYEPAALAELWRVREDGAGHSARFSDGTKAWPGFEDSAVPPERLGAYLRDLRALLAEHGMQAISYGHYGEGCVHLRVGFGLDGPDGPGRYERARRWPLAGTLAPAPVQPGAHRCLRCIPTRVGPKRATQPASHRRSTADHG